MKAILKIAAGIGLILIGVVGLILPIMPGWAFIIPGMVLLSDYCPPIKRLLDWGKARWEKHSPHFARKRQPASDAASDSPETPAA